MAATFLQPISAVAEIIAPASLASAVAVGASAILALAPLVSSSGAAPSVMFQMFISAVRMLPKRKRTWGTVYDARTKRPLAFAKVQLLDTQKRVLETRVTDREGRYGFLTTPESLRASNISISILPSAPGYTFPAKTPASVDAFVYNNLYRGGSVTVSDQTLINFDIPMDPLRLSPTSVLAGSPSIALGISVAALADAGLWVGAVVVPLNVILMPNPFTLGVLFLFLGTASLRIWGITEHPFGTVIDRTTGRPMPFALMTLNDLRGRRIAFTVSDERGRYFLTAPRGTYELTVVTPATVSPPREVKHHIETRKGWLTNELRI